MLTQSFRKRRSASLAATSRSLRSTPSAELLIWERLMDRRLDGLRFVRCAAVGGHQVDFYCSTHRLAVEVDADASGIETESDRLRRQEITQYGVSLLRFSARDVHFDLESVCAAIIKRAHLLSRSAQTTVTK